MLRNPVSAEGVPTSTTGFDFEYAMEPTVRPESGRILQNQLDYSPQKLAEDFACILDDMHYGDVMEIFGMGMFQLTQRKHIKREFRALYIALWRLALVRSFPGIHDEVFHSFMELDASRHKKRKEYVTMAALALQYVDKLKEHGDSDFSDISRHMLSFMEFDERQTKAMILKLALHIRRMYGYFFDNLM